MADFMGNHPVGCKIWDYGYLHVYDDFPDLSCFRLNTVQKAVVNMSKASVKTQSNAVQRNSLKRIWCLSEWLSFAFLHFYMLLVTAIYLYILFDIISKGIGFINWSFLSDAPHQGMTEGGFSIAGVPSIVFGLFGVTFFVHDQELERLRFFLPLRPIAYGTDLVLVVMVFIPILGATLLRSHFRRKMSQGK